MTPALEVESREVIRVEINDCFFQQITRENTVLTAIDH